MESSGEYHTDGSILSLITAMVDSNSFEDLAKRLATKFAELFQVELCTIWRRIAPPDGNERLVLNGSFGMMLGPGVPPPTYVINREARSNNEIDGVTPWIAIREQICLANSFEELRDDPSRPWHGAHRGTWDATQFKEGKKFKSLLGLPILYQDPENGKNELIGVLKMESKQGPSGFSAGDQGRAVSLMPFVAALLKNMVMREQHEQRRQQVIRTLTTALLKQQDPYSFYQQVVDQTAALLNADLCSLWLMDIDRKKLKLGANYGVQNKASAPEYVLNWNAKEDEEIAGLTPWVAIRKRSFWGERHEDLKANKAWKGNWDPNQWADKPFGCLYAVPLLDMNNACFGVLKIENSFYKPKFDPVDRATFDLMADFISLAIELNSRLRSDVIYDFFHLLKQPVSNTVLAFDDLTTELDNPTPRPERIASRLDMMRRNLQTVRVWIQNVYGLAATRSDAPGTKALAVPLKKILTDAVKNMRALFPKEFKCKIQCDPGLSVKLTPLQRKKVDAILFNILDNSFKYSNPPRHIDASVAITANGIDLVVRDNGRGIKEEDQPHVFEPFFTRGADMWPASMGLGLSTVARLLTELNWKYAIKSRVKVGTEFCISIPNEVVV